MNYPSEEQIEEFAKSYSDPVFVTHVCQAFMDVVQKVNPEPPAKPEFPEWVKWCAQDGLTKNWYAYEYKPVEYDYTDDEWNYDKGKLTNDFFSDKHILWLWYINSNRPPEESLIKLENYK